MDCLSPRANKKEWRPVDADTAVAGVEAEEASNAESLANATDRTHSDSDAEVDEGSTAASIAGDSASSGCEPEKMASDAGQVIGAV